MVLRISIAESSIQLCQLLKLIFPSISGGEAKVKIQNGEVKINGVVETRKKAKVLLHSIVSIQESNYEVVQG